MIITALIFILPLTLFKKGKKEKREVGSNNIPFFFFFFIRAGDQKDLEFPVLLFASPLPIFPYKSFTFTSLSLSLLKKKISAVSVVFGKVVEFGEVNHFPIIQNF